MPTGKYFSQTAEDKLARAVKALIAADLKQEDQQHATEKTREERAPKTNI